MWVEEKRDISLSEGTVAMTSSNQDTDGHRNNSDDDIEPSDLAVFSTNSAEVDCAHDIFSAFMLGMARDIVKLGGKDNHESEPRKIPDGMNILRETRRQLWSNTIIDQLANAVRASGLVGDIEEAYVLIVPALASEDLLPEVTSSNMDELQWHGGERSYWTIRSEHAGPYGERLYHSFSLSACESEIWRWSQASFSTQNIKKDMENFEKIADLVFQPEDRLSTRRKEITTICNRTRAAMYLLSDLADKNGRSPQRATHGRGFKDIMWKLEEAHERMVPGVPLPDKEELNQMYPNLLSDIPSIAEGG
jgi:hypothetical protein